jgi:hypothetical protein
MKQSVGILSLLFTLVFICGCNKQRENAETPNEKQARLIVIENAQLKEEIQILNRRLQSQNKKCEKEIRDLKAVISKAKKTNNELKDLLKEDSNWQEIEEFMTTLATTLGEDNDRLVSENRSLKAEIEELKSRIEELEDSGQ